VPGLNLLPRSVDGMETILAYRARGELIGEMGVLRGLPRSATCVAYIHERDELARKEAAKRELEAVELVHLPAGLFTDLLQDPRFARKVDSIFAERLQSDKQVMTGPVTAPLQSERFKELGLIQGQRLMLIDLDRCTRCDECVTACVNSHSDGRSRLFLDGPRFGQYLVPATCRSCLDPVCMIGCPVGSIHRGDNGQIVIEDWCIGCEMCARQCPYGSILMHDTGIIPEGSYAWSMLGEPAATTADDKPAWAAVKYRARGWRPVKAPVTLNRDVLAGKPPAATYAFRHEFMLEKERLTEGDEFKIEVTTPPAAQVQVWVDGALLDPEEVKRDKRTYPVPDAPRVLKPGRHVVAARVVPPAEHAGPIFELRGDVVRRPKGAQLNAADYIEKGVTEVAVVCDLCSSLPGKVPSCVRACPHDAAMRVDARRTFPA
jgi:Fe-S-cluster-containing hydrogenase component 2